MSVRTYSCNATSARNYVNPGLGARDSETEAEFGPEPAAEASFNPEAKSDSMPPSPPTGQPRIPLTLDAQ